MMQPAQIIKEHEERSGLYARFGYDLDKERAAVIRAAGPLNGDILEIGPGRGNLTLALAREGLKVVAVDIEQAKIDQAAALLAAYGMEDRVCFRKEDAHQLSFPDRSFDFIFCANVVHHLEGVYQVLEEMLRVCRPGGSLIIGDFHPAGLKVIEQIHQARGQGHHSGGMMPEEVQRFFEAKGLDAKKVETDIQTILTITKQACL